MRWPSALASVVGLSLVLAACSAGEAETGQPVGDEQAIENGGSSEVDMTIASDDGEVLVVTSDRPDWLPAWLLLPEGLNISAAMNTPGTGDAAVTGSVPDSNADELYDDALFMAQSGGYVVTEEFVAGARGFAAEHTSDGSELVFTVVQVVDDIHQWSWEFVGVGGGDDRGGSARPAPGAGDIGLEPLPRRGNLTITVTNPRVFSRIDGACDGTNSQVQFISDDDLTKFIVFTGDAVGAAGEVTVDVEGEQLTWVAAADSETSTSQTDRTSAYYEGDFLQGSDVAFAVVQMVCNE